MLFVSARDTGPALADPAYGNLAPFPSSSVYIQGHRFGIPIRMTTCPDTTNVTGTATGGGLMTLTDTSKSWTANQWAGYDLMLTTGTGSVQTRTIASNTSNTLTVSSGWGGVLTSGSASGGTINSLQNAGANWLLNEFAGKTLELTTPGGPQTRTILYNSPDTLYAAATGSTLNSGTATGSTLTTLVDTSKSWSANQWAGKVVEVTSGAASPQTREIVSNTNNTLTVITAWQEAATGTATSATTTTLTDNTRAWAANIWAGYQIELTSGTGAPQTRTVSSNTSNTITVSSAFSPAPAAGTAYLLRQLPNATSGYAIKDAPYATHVSGNATGGTSTALADTSKSWTTNQWANKVVEIKSGIHAGQSRIIVSNTSNTLTLADPWPIADGGSATSGTTSVLTDASQSWTTNQWTGYTIELTSGTGAPQTRIVASNTADTITPTVAFSPAPAANTVYQLLQVPNATSAYRIRDGFGLDSTFEIKQTSNPASGTGYNVLKLHCHPGAFDIEVTYNETDFDVMFEGNIATSGTSTTLTDTSRTWKINQWVGSQVLIVGGAGTGQRRTVVSNTATSLTVSPAWTSPMPGSGSIYQVGGIADGGWLGSTGRTVSCPGGQILGSGTAQIHCVTQQTLPQGPTGSGNLAHLVVEASPTLIGTRFFFLTIGQVLEVDGSIIPADVGFAQRTIIRCPDPNSNNVINAQDLGLIAQAIINPALYTPSRDPNNNGIVNAQDLGLAAAPNVFLKNCIQP
jgi:hypothetical protein